MSDPFEDYMSPEARRHRERMALEQRRDRVESMRAEGYDESEIRDAERKRGCSGFLRTSLVVLFAGVAIFVWSTSNGGRSNEPITAADVSPPTEEMYSDESPDDTVPEVVSEESVEPYQYAEPTSQPELLRPNPEQDGEGSAEREIIYVQEEVAQPLPDQTDPSTDTP